MLDLDIQCGHFELKDQWKEFKMGVFFIQNLRILNGCLQLIGEKNNLPLRATIHNVHVENKRINGGKMIFLGKNTPLELIKH